MKKLLSLNIIGAGHLGQTIGKLFHLHNAAMINAVFNRSRESTDAAVNFIGAGKSCYSLADLPEADITLITVNDDAIQNLCNQISQLRKFKLGSVVVHCSGSLTSEVLSSAALSQCYVASIHPLHSFANPELSVKQFDGIQCAMEGDLAALKILQEIFLKIGAQPFQVERNKKALYHAGSVIASNYMVTLAHAATQCFIDSGINKATAYAITSHLMKGVLVNINCMENYSEALTGPIKRGDIHTINQHVSAINDEKIRTVYKNLARLTLELTSHSTEEKLKLLSVLGE